jgi:hypothetical protein
VRAVGGGVLRDQRAVLGQAAGMGEEHLADRAGLGTAGAVGAGLRRYGPGGSGLAPATRKGLRYRRTVWAMPLNPGWHSPAVMAPALVTPSFHR